MKLSAKSLVVIGCALSICTGVIGGMKYQSEKDNREGLVLFYGQTLNDIQIYSLIEKLLKEDKQEKAIKLVVDLKNGAKITEKFIGKNLAESEKEEAKKPYNDAL